MDSDHDIPDNKVWDPQNPRHIPISNVEFSCNTGCCKMRTIPLRVIKASSIHKAQGISVGPDEEIKRCVVGLSAGERQNTPGLDLVGLSRATVPDVLAIWNDTEISRKDIIKMGRGKGYDLKREFEHKLKMRQAKTVPPCIKQITGLSDAKTFGDGFEFLVQWFRAHTNSMGPCNIDKDSINSEIETCLEAFKSEAKAEAEAKAEGKHHVFKVADCFRFLTFLFCVYRDKTERRCDDVTQEEDCSQKDCPEDCSQEDCSEDCRQEDCEEATTEKDCHVMQNGHERK
jgi:hypothetical protein